MWRISDVPIFEHSWQTRRGTDWQSEHKKQAQQHDLELDTVYPFDVMQGRLWLRNPPSTPVQFVNTARSPVNPSESGPVQSVDTPLQVALGNHSHVPRTPTVEFYAVQSKVQPPPTWLSSLNKQQWITNVLLLQAKSLKKSEHPPWSVDNVVVTDPFCSIRFS